MSMSYRKLASAVLASACLSFFGIIAPTHAGTMITVEGTIAPWLFSNGYYQGQLIDPGIFAPAGTSLTGDAIQIVWTTQLGYGTAGDNSPADLTFSAAITINGTTVTLGGTGHTSFGVIYPYTVIQPDYQNITVANAPNIAVNSYDPSLALLNPHGLGGSLELIGPGSTPLDGYFYVTSMDSPWTPVPGPIVGAGPVGMLACVFLIAGLVRKYRARLA